MTLKKSFRPKTRWVTVHPVDEKLLSALHGLYKSRKSGGVIDGGKMYYYKIDLLDESKFFRKVYNHYYTQKILLPTIKVTHSFKSGPY